MEKGGDHNSAGTAAITEDAQGVRPKLILNIMSGSNDEKSVVMRHEELAGSDVVFRHPRVPPLHGETTLLFIYNI